jgi:dTDP-4-dehydrorhamnose 3,5-epimerase
MTIYPASLPDLYIIEPKVLGDHRGYFSETFRLDKLVAATGLPLNFVQDNESRSVKGVLRGLHFQQPPVAQSKLVRVTEGRILDVAVDIRHGSPTFGQAVTIELSAENKKQFFIPRGFAHGFVVLSDFATLQYKTDNYYSAEHDKGLGWNDPALNINWPFAAEQLILSVKDQQQPMLKDLQSGFQFGATYYD